MSVQVPAQLSQRLKASLGNLQMLPAVAVEALQVANDPNGDLLKLAKVIQRDLKLTTSILRLANSALFSPPHPIASLHHAISSMGVRRCRDILVTSGMDSVSRKVAPALEARREALWKHGFLTAIFAVKINHLLGLKFQGEEYTAGLMHDFGRTLLAVAVPEQCEEIDPLDFIEPADIEERERNAIGVSHAEFGAWFAQTNELPAALVASIQYHQDPASAGEHRNLAALVAAADHVASYMQRTDERDPYNPMTNSAMLVLQQAGTMNATGVFSDAVDKFVAEAPALAEQLMKE
jgi:HD-like signal output (HDOD) protein